MSRTVRELLAEALAHFDAAAEYAQVTDRDPRMILDAMSMRLFAGLETLTRLPDGVADHLFSGEWPTCEASATGLHTAMALSA
ncbi:MAG: hypothetical protein WKF50_02280 [Nocardioides sp.]